MPKDEWGVKRACPHCASRFYDLKHDPMKCPECGQTFSLDSLTASRGRIIVAEKAPVRERELAEVEDIAVEEEIDPAAGEAELDDDLLEDDEDDTVPLEEIADVEAPGEER